MRPLTDAPLSRRACFRARRPVPDAAPVAAAVARAAAASASPPTPALDGPAVALLALASGVSGVGAAALAEDVCP